MILNYSHFKIKNKHYLWTNKYPLILNADAMLLWGIHLKIDILIIQAKMIARHRISRLIK